MRADDEGSPNGHRHWVPDELVVLHYPGDDLFAPYERRRGLPIGNLTSQFFANLYLNRFRSLRHRGGACTLCPLRR